MSLLFGKFTCSLCGREVRSVYALPGDSKAQFCSKCFFGEPPATNAHPANTEVPRV